MLMISFGKRALIVIVFYMGYIGAIQAQRSTVKVLNAQTKLSVVGVTVKDNNGQQWLTDTSGQVYIELGKEGKLLQFSLMGYQSIQRQVLPIGQPIEILLSPSVLLLKEVELATGYQKLNRDKLTGSYVIIDSTLLNRRVSSNILAKLEDLATGLIFNRDASTNGAINLNIRGISTVNSDPQPLIVLDNFPFNGQIEDINPNDIESVSILKDASAAAIWGAKAGNGVIVLTSKRARFNQQQQINLNVNATFAPRPDLFLVPVMSTADYIAAEQRLFNEGYYKATEQSVNHLPLSPVIELLIAKRDGKVTAMAVESELARLAQLDVRNEYSKYLYRNSLNQQYSLSINGGNQLSNYSISLGLDQNAESLKRNDFSRKTLASSYGIKLWKDRLIWDNTINYTLSSRANNNQGYNYLGPNGGILYPYAELKAANGSNLATSKTLRNDFIGYAASKGLLDWNYSVLDELDQSDNVFTTDNLNLNSNLELKILKGVSVNLRYQWNKIQNIRRQEYGPDSYFTRNLINRFTILNTDQSLIRPIPLGAIVDWDRATQHNSSVRPQLNIVQSIGPNGNLSALVGYEIRLNELQVQRYRWYGYDAEFEAARPVDYFGTYVSFVNNGAKNNQIPNVDALQRLNDRYRSFFTNIIYSLNQKYIFSASARLDQSNLFGVSANQKGVPLWSVGMAWNLSKEAFFNEGNKTDLKLRLSYGYNGNINKSLSAYTTATYNNGASTQNRLVLAAIQNPPNADLRWERVQIINTGLELTAWDRKLTTIVDVYSKKGLDLIGTSPMAPASGVVQFTGNSANTKTFGTDINLNLKQKMGALDWNVNLMYSLVKEKVTAYHLPAANNRYLQSINLPREGYPLYAIYAYKWAGLDPLNGDPMGYLSGVVSSNYLQIKNLSTFDEITYVGPARPTSFGAFRNNFTFNKLSLSVNISYRLGYHFRKPSIVYGNEYGMGGHGDYYQRWKAVGDELHTSIPSVPSVRNALRDEFYLYSDVLVGKGDHIRLQDITLAYELSKAFARLKLRGVSLYGYVNNVGLIWTANKWHIDPDYHLMRPVRSVAVGFKINL